MPDLDAVLKTLFLDVFEIDAEEYSDDLTYEDTPDWDSLGHMKMVAALTEEFAVDFDIEEVMAMESVAHIKRIVAGKLAS
ncbi:acyl carrier protein [bacterium DOLZORAL124_64_63]|nr:MAG: acyl carrier protein [bacterium DOLZORAL124_64_63]